MDSNMFEEIDKHVKFKASEIADKVFSQKANSANYDWVLTENNLGVGMLVRRDWVDQIYKDFGYSHTSEEALQEVKNIIAQIKDSRL